MGPKPLKKVGNFGKVASSKIIDDVAVLEGTIIMLKLSAGARAADVREYGRIYNIQPSERPGDACDNQLLYFGTHLSLNWLTDLIDDPAESHTAYYLTSLFNVFSDNLECQIIEHLRGPAGPIIRKSELSLTTLRITDNYENLSGPCVGA